MWLVNIRMYTSGYIIVMCYSFIDIGQWRETSLDSIFDSSHSRTKM